MLQAKTTVKFWRKRHNVCPRDRQRKNIATIHLRMTPMTRHWPGLSGKPWMCCGQRKDLLGVLLKKRVLWDLEDFFLPVSCHYSEKAMANHSSTLAWKIPWTEEPGGLQSMGHTESDTTEVT